MIRITYTCHSFYAESKDFSDVEAARKFLAYHTFHSKGLCEGGSIHSIAVVRDIKLDMDAAEYERLKQEYEAFQKEKKRKELEEEIKEKEELYQQLKWELGKE